MKKALLIGAALLGTVCFAGAQTLSSAKMHVNKTMDQTPREEATLQFCGDLPEPGPDVQYNFVGVNDPAVLFGAALFESTDLEEYAGWEIRSIDIFGNVQGAVFNGMVWNMDQEVLAESGDYPLSSETLITNLPLQSPYKIKAGDDLYVGYRVDTPSGFPMGLDFNEAEQGYGDLISMYGEDGNMTPFASLFEVTQGAINNNFYIVARLSNETGVEAVITNDKIAAVVNNGVITVKGANGRQVSLVDMTGKVVYTGTATTIAAPQKGVYILRVGNRNLKLAI